MKLIDLEYRHDCWQGSQDGRATFVCSEEEMKVLNDYRYGDPCLRDYEIERKRIMLKNNKNNINNDIKVIFNNPATILFINGNKYVSKVHNEPFDEEKGLLMCLAKANGISHLELQRIIKNAKRPTKEQE